MTSSIVSPQPTRPPRGAGRIIDRIAPFAPLIVLLVTSFGTPNLSSPMYAAPPDVLDVPLGIVLTAIVMGWMLIGVAIVWTARSRLAESLALVFFTIPATVAVVFGPAVILILQNLG